MQTQTSNRTKSLMRLALATCGLIAVAAGSGIIAPRPASAAQTTWRTIPGTSIAYREQWLANCYEVLVHNDGSKTVKSMTVVIVYDTGLYGSGRTTSSVKVEHLSSGADAVGLVGPYKELISVDVEDEVRGDHANKAPNAAAPFVSAVVACLQPTDAGDACAG